MKIIKNLLIIIFIILIYTLILLLLKKKKLTYLTSEFFNLFINYFFS